MHRVRLLACVALVAFAGWVPAARGSITGSTPPLTKPSAPPASRVVDADRRLAAQRATQRVAHPVRLNGVDNSEFIDVNNIKMFVTNTGSFAWDKTSGNAGLEFPKGTGKTCVFAAGLWMGGQVAGQTRVVVSEYSDEYGPGAMVGAAPDDPKKAEYKVYKLFRNYTDTATRDAALADYNAGAVIHGAPAVTVQPDGSLDILGDEMMWSVYNDADPSNHTNRAGTTAPLGFEVQQTTFAFNRQGALGNVIFISYRIINKGGNTINNMFVSQWSDPDDGYAGDDLVGCDIPLSVGFVYNGTNNDNIYGAQVPSVGYDFFRGPIKGTAPGDTLGMSSFNGYTNGTDPDNFTKTYNLMQGLQSDGSPRINPVTGLPTTFMFSGDPVLGSGWLDTNTPQDVRLQLSSGPFTMSPGDTQVVTTAIVIGQSKNRFASISQMKFYDTEAQAAFDKNFKLPAPPNSPRVNATPLNNGVRLTWDTSSEQYNQPPYLWEAYVVYQGASIAGPWTRIGTFDRIDGITTVLDNDFNEEQGLILPTGKAFGTDAGTQYSIDLTTDAVRGGPLHVGTTYYYSVDAYSVGLGQTPQVLESAFNAIPVVPQTPAGGVDLTSSSLSPVAQSQYSTVPPPTTDVVTASVVDPIQVKSASYLVGFKPTCATCTQRSWYVVRTAGAAVDTVVNNWPNFSADQQNPVFDGIQVKVLSYPSGTLGNVAYVDTAGGHPAALQGVDRGMRWFGGGGGYAADDLGGTIPSGSPAPNTEIRFTGGSPGQKAYRYVRMLDSKGNRVYFYGDSAKVGGNGGYVDVPFVVWDLDANKQKNAAFLENAGPPPAANFNGMWDPSAAGDGGREAVWVMASDYSGNTPDPVYADSAFSQDLLGGNLDLLYEVFPNLTDPSAVIDAGDKIQFITSIPSTHNDYFTFSTTAVNQFNASLAKDELNQVLAVPNPYFNHSSYELNQFARVVKFTHLPAVCTVRLFNLAGDLVRTLQKNDNTSQLTWDLLTDRGLPVASGIYIFHVDAPSVGTKVGKVAIFMEKERLNTY